MWWGNGFFFFSRGVVKFFSNVGLEKRRSMQLRFSGRIRTLAIVGGDLTQYNTRSSPVSHQGTLKEGFFAASRIQSLIKA